MLCLIRCKPDTMGASRYRLPPMINCLNRSAPITSTFSGSQSNECSGVLALFANAVRCCNSRCIELALLTSHNRQDCTNHRRRCRRFRMAVTSSRSSATLADRGRRRGSPSALTARRRLATCRSEGFNDGGTLNAKTANTAREQPARHHNVVALRGLSQYESRQTCCTCVVVASTVSLCR